ncbi:MAG: hypothetical protein EXR77_08510 [Myxococcales bacterium]|nr:hypothetical protein [Myxococcales bacterium]
MSGGIDSAAVALWLQRAGAQVTALSLDFGDAGHEREQAQAVATHLGIALQLVPVDGETLDVLAWHPDSDFGPTDQTHPMVNRTLLSAQGPRSEPPSEPQPPD